MKKFTLEKSEKMLKNLIRLPMYTPERHDIEMQKYLAKREKM
jgi:hypothetical protein